MAVYAAIPLAERSGEDSRDSRTISVKYHVYTNVISTPLVDILNASGLPQINDLLSGETNLYCARRPYEKQSPIDYLGQSCALWTITCQYERTSPGNNNQSQDAITGETSRLINYSFDFNTIEKIVEKAYDTGDSFGNPTKPINNTAGEAFDPPLKDIKYNTVIRWTQKESSSFNTRTLKNYRNTVNRSAITILDTEIRAGCGLMKKILPTPKLNEDGDKYYEVQYEVEIDEEGWQPKLRNQGFRQKVNGYLVDILKQDLNPNAEWDNPDEALQRIENPADLSNSGAVIIPGIADTVYLTFKTKYEQNWNSLNLVSRIA